MYEKIGFYDIYSQQKALTVQTKDPDGHIILDLLQFPKFPWKLYRNDIKIKKL